MLGNLVNSNIIKAKLYLMLYRTRNSPLRIALGLGSILWAILLYLPGETMSLPCYILMLNIMPEYNWAGLFATHGIYTMYNNYRGIDSRFSYIIEGVLGSYLWTASTLYILYSTGFAVQAAVAGTAALAVSSWWNVATMPINKGV